MDANFITKKAGPFPVWAWIGLGVAALLVLSAYKSKKATGTIANASAGMTGSSAANLPNGTAFNPQDLTVVQEGYNPPQITVNVPPTDGRVPSTPASGFVNFIRDATDGKMYGVNSTGYETLISQDAYKALGAPAFAQVVAVIPHTNDPSPVVRPAPAAAPPPPPPAAPAKQSVIVSPWTPGATPWNSTLWGIAQHFYNDGSQYGRIAQANGIANPNLIYPGQRIVIP